MPLSIGDAAYDPFIGRQSFPTSAEAIPVFPPEARRRPARWLDTLIALSVADLRVRYGRGAFQLIKWLVDPFALVGVYLVLVTLVLDRPGHAPGLSLACAVIPFQLVLLSAFSAIAAIHGRQNIILNMGFERMLIPIASVVTETIAFGASFLLLVMMMGIYGVAPTVAVLWLPVVLLVCIAFAVACAYPISLFGIWFPHLRPLAGSLVRTLFFLSPGVVPLSEIHGRTHDLLKLNPLTGLFEAFRSLFLYGRSPAAWELLYPLGLAALLLAAFVPVYRREETQFAKIVEMQ
jgi:lipopolysaccharide transport system permease protein